MVARNPNPLDTEPLGPAVGLSLMIEEDFRQASLELFRAGEVDVLEWSFDTGWGDELLPAWVEPLLDFYALSGQLLGHGVTFSPLSGQWQERQDQWLANFQGECERREYRHISEHFGFMTAGSFHRGAPLPVPMTSGSLRVGRDRLKKLADVSGKPIGLENLAFAFGIDDVKRQGEFLNALLKPVNGFIVLDLHNIYCQSHNFQILPDTLLDSYPLHLVRELHVSGGSWSQSSDMYQLIRRDTHDGPVPSAVFEVLELALQRCPHVHSVIFERLGGSIKSVEDSRQFRSDFRQIRAAVKRRQHVPA